MELLSPPSSGKPQEMWRQAVAQIASQFERSPSRPVSRWEVYQSPVKADGGDNSYDGFFRPVFPNSVASLHDNVALFEQMHGRKPLWLEVMGNPTLLGQLGVPGAAIELVSLENQGAKVAYDLSRYHINCDLLNLDALTSFVPFALSNIDPQARGFDFITWKGEGGLQKVFSFLPPTLLYLDLFYKILSPGGSGYFQLPAGRTDLCVTLQQRAPRYADKLTVVYAESRQSFQRNALRIDKLAPDIPSLFEIFYG